MTFPAYFLLIPWRSTCGPFRAIPLRFLASAAWPCWRVGPRNQTEVFVSSAPAQAIEQSRPSALLAPTLPPREAPPGPCSRTTPPPRQRPRSRWTIETTKGRSRQPPAVLGLIPRERTAALRLSGG